MACSFCGKEPREIILMIAGADGGEPRICNECLCAGMAALARTDGIDFDALVAAAKRDDSWEDADARAKSSSGENLYRDIDPVVERWVARYRLVLQTEGDGEARFWYSSMDNETFQMSVSPSNAGIVLVTAATVETDDAAEFHAEWAVPLADLERTLGIANDIIDLWHRRPIATGQPQPRGFEL